MAHLKDELHIAEAKSEQDRQNKMSELVELSRTNIHNMNLLMEKDRVIQTLSEDLTIARNDQNLTAEHLDSCHKNNLDLYNILG